MFFSARLAISVVIGGALLIPAASCGGDSGRDVTPLAEVEATTSTTTVSGDRGTAASTTSEPSKASAAEPPEAGDSSDSTGTTVTPTSAPSAERFADGSVVSAGGYEAKTPAVARGLLLEPEWTDEQQEAADVIHEYLDAMITTVTDTKPDTEIPTSMTDLERPDLNSQTAYWVFDLSTLEGGRLQVAMCEYNQFDVRDIATDKLIDDGASSSFWDGQIAPTDAGWRMVTLLHQGSKKGRTGCADED